MKTVPNDQAARKVRQVKGETNKKLRKLILDPTLEGIDEDKVGRIQRKVDPVEDPR